jgi:hypothetical protein
MNSDGIANADPIIVCGRVNRQSTDRNVRTLSIDSGDDDVDNEEAVDEADTSTTAKSVMLDDSGIDGDIEDDSKSCVEEAEADDDDADRRPFATA